MKLFVGLLALISGAESKKVRGYSTAGAPTVLSDSQQQQQQDHRRTEIASASFLPSTCAPATCIPWPHGTSSTNEIIVGCTECFTMEGFTAGEEITLGGLNIIGKLDFPSGTKVTVKTPYVFVQGELAMSSDAVVDGEEDVKIVLTGSEDVMFMPSSPNTAACPSGGCNVGSRPIVVAGGKMNIQGLPESCPAWSYPHSSSGEVANVYYSESDTIATFPIEDDFSNGIGEWSGYLGSIAEVTDVGHSSPYLHITKRKASFQGPFFDIPKTIWDSIALEDLYEFSALIKISKEGGESNCVSNGSNCPVLRMNRMSGGNDITIRPLFDTTGQISADNEWTPVKGFFTFSTTGGMEINDVFAALTINGPEVGVDISIDDFQIAHAHYSNIDPNANACSTLMDNGDASRSDSFTYPFRTWLKKDPLTVEKDDDGNNYFHLAKRSAPYSSITLPLNTDCTVEGATYSFSMKFRTAAITGIEARVLLKVHKEEGSHSFNMIAKCPKAKAETGWVTCRADFIFSAEHAASPLIEFLVVTPQDSSPCDYDDLFFASSAGVTLDENTGSCWGADAQVLISSTSNDYSSSSVTSIASMIDGTATFSDTIAHATTVEEDSNYATEIALLSRNIAFESDDPASGGHLIVLDSDTTQQTIEGVAFKGFGQEGVKNRYPINFHLAGDASGSSVSKNSIVDSHQRCLVLSGTENMKISQNVAYNTKGHCYVLQDGSESGNTFDSNLGAVTRAATAIIDGETDHSPATFFITNPANSFTGNVAAGSEDTGFWFDIEAAVKGDSATVSKYTGISPSELLLTAFTDNVSHSNKIGLKTYPGEYIPPAPVTFSGTKVYSNTETGIFLHHGKNFLIDGGVISDNLLGIDVNLADNIKISNLVVNGAAGRSDPCEGASEPLMGIRLGANLKDSTLSGTTLSAVTIKNFNADTTCTAGALGTNMNSVFDSSTFSATSTFSGVSFLDVASKFSLCSATEKGLKGVKIADNGSLNPTGSMYDGFVVSDDVAGEFAICEPIPEACAQYCADDTEADTTCYRPVTLSVPSDVSYELEIGNDISSQKITATTTANAEPTWWKNRNSFSVSLPAGSYTASFTNSETLAREWPGFVEVVLGDAPADCAAVLEEGDITVESPTEASCTDLVSNGDFETGTIGANGWYDTGCGSKNVTGFATGTALSTNGRDNQYQGLAQHLDTRCMQAGSIYKIAAKVKITAADGSVASCDPAVTTAGDNACIRANVKSNLKGEMTAVELSAASTVAPFTAGAWNDLYGTFTVTEHMIAADNVVLYFDGPASGIDIEIDNVSVVETTVDCSNLIFNGDFSQGTNGWKTIGPNTGLKLVDGVEGQALSTVQREQWAHGMAQDANKDCLVEGQEYEVSMDVMMTDYAGNPLTCDPFSYYFTQNACPTLAMRFTHHTTYDIAKPIGPWNATGWNKVYGTFRAEPEIFDEGLLEFYVARAWSGKNEVVDNVSIKPVTANTYGLRTCDQLIINGDAETGDARYWFIKGSGETGDLKLVSPGANGSKYAFHHYGTREKLFNGMWQKLDQDCMPVGSLWKITFNIKLLDPEGNEAMCDKTIRHGAGVCPQAFVQSHLKGGGVVNSLPLKNVNTDAWATGQWNAYEVTFKMEQKFLDGLETWWFIHQVKPGWTYMVDDISMVPL